MKKIILILILCFPLTLNAVVNENTTTTFWEVASDANAKKSCEDAVKENGGLVNVSRGYYLECIEVSCNNNLNVHNKLNNIAVTCSNGNTNPSAIINSSVEKDSIKEGSRCTESGAYLYFTQRIYYNCDLKADGTPYAQNTSTTTSSTTTTTSRTTTTTKSDNIQESPETGIEDYTLLFIVAILSLIVGLGIANKKNIFKNI